MTQKTKPVEVRQEHFTFNGTGEIFSFTTLQDAPQAFLPQAPYVLALIKLDEGPIITAQLTDIDDEVTIGDRVEMVTRKLLTEGEQGMIVYGYKFRKVLDRA